MGVRTAPDSRFMPKAGDSLKLLDTPALIVDLAVVEANIGKLFERVRGTKVAVRPHMKTAKCPEVARMYLAAGAEGICVAKVSEAEVMAAAGIEDILITTEIVGEIKVKRLIELLRQHPKIKIVVDSIVAAAAIDRAAGHLESKIAVLIEVNVGQNRAGVEPNQAALKLAQDLQHCKNLRLVGVQGYEGHLQMLPDHKERERLCREAMSKLTATADLLRANGLAIDVVTTGGTGTSEFCADCSAVTEIQPGSFVFMDVAYRGAAGSVYGQALSLLATVISKPAASRVVIDAGLKSLSTDSGFAEVRDYPQYKYRPGGDEHGILETDESAMSLAIGERVHLIPSHIDTTVNLHDYYFCHRGGVLEQIWPIAARGKVQ